MLEDIIFRQAEPEDDGFLFSQYLQRRTPELAALGWRVGEIQSFLRMQFDMRRQAFQDRYPGSDCRIIQLGDVRVGQMIVYRTANQLALVDISVSTEFRDGGIGSESIRRLQNEAEHADVTIILHVDRTNPGARRLYLALGFAVTDDNDEVSLEMKWYPTKLR